MHEFHVCFRSLLDILDFVSLASKQNIPLIVGTDRCQVNATSFMGIFALNCRKPQTVTVTCSDAEFADLMTAFDRFLVK